MKLIKKCRIISIVLLTVLVILLVIPNIVEADPVLDPDYYKPSSTDSVNFTPIERKANAIIGIIQVIGSIVSVGSLVAMGIRYMFGSIEEKAEYKKSMIPYLLGAILLFAGSNILGIFYNFFTTLEVQNRKA